MGRDIPKSFQFRAGKARNTSAVIFVAFVASICAALIPHGGSVSQKSAAPPAVESAIPSGFPSAPGSPVINLALVQSSRLIYPYSIIPGGVSSARDLKSAIASDPVVASHYSGFDLAKVRVTRLNKELGVYISYRIGNKVYWTSHKHALRADEKIITDGLHSARTRCGNRLSGTPVKPVYSKEPPIAELETPEPGVLSFPLESPVTSWISSGPTSAPPGSDHGGFILPIVPIFVGGGSPTSPSHNPPPTNPIPPITPVTQVPEPSTLLLLATGFSASLWMRRKFKPPEH